MLISCGVRRDGLDSPEVPFGAPRVVLHLRRLHQIVQLHFQGFAQGSGEWSLKLAGGYVFLGPGPMGQSPRNSGRGLA